MKRIVLLSAVVLVAFAAPFVRAEGSLSDTELQTIQANCVNAQIAMQRVQESDLLTRLSRGNRYEALLKLMTSFNGRVVQNKLDAPDLITITSDYQKALDGFRDDYTNYDEALAKIIKLDCRNSPTTFNDQLVDLRVKRASLAARVKQFDRLLDNYLSGAESLQKELGVTL